MGERTCRECGLVKPLDAKHFEKQPWGFRRVCRTCRIAYNLRRYHQGKYPAAPAPAASTEFILGQVFRGGRA